MTDPVETDALRAKAREVGRKYRSALAAEIECDTLAAADEVDRLRRRITELEPMVVATSTDRRLLRAVIENAPHQNSCRTFDPTTRKCTCWKADAL